MHFLESIEEVQLIILVKIKGETITISGAGESKIPRKRWESD
jgi:hypothetical protein